MAWRTLRTTDDNDDPDWVAAGSSPKPGGGPVPPKGTGSRGTAETQRLATDAKEAIKTAS